jgi:hypothetical protein
LITQQSVANNLTDGDSVPRSARVNFILTGSQRLKDDDAFAALVARADALTSTFHAGIKAVIVEKALLEVESIKKELIRATINSVCLLAKLTVLAAPDVPTHDDMVFLYARSALRLDAMQRIAGDSGSLADTLGDFIRPPLTETSLSAGDANSSLANFCNACTGLFAEPLNAFDKKANDIRLDLAMASIKQLHITDSATAASAMQIDAEPTATPESLRSLIALQVAEATQPLHDKIAELTTDLKGQRGASRASLKNKNPPGKAAAANSDTARVDKKTSSGRSLNEKRRNKNKPKSAPKK